MEKLNEDFEDFLLSVNEGYKDFVRTVNELVLQENYINIKVKSSKTNLFTVSYSQPKTRLGIVNFYVRKKSFKMVISGRNCAKYPDVLKEMPEEMIKQIDKVQDCKNMLEPGTCMDKCIGYTFDIGDVHYQKCRFGCFRFDINEQSIPFLLKMLERELEERRAV